MGRIWTPDRKIILPARGPFRGAPKRAQRGMFTVGPGFWKSGGGVAYSITDNFTGSNGDPILGRTTTTGGKTWAIFSEFNSPAAQIQSNAALLNGLINDSHTQIYVPTNSANQDITCTVVSLGATPVYFGLTVRIVDINNFVSLLYNGAGSGATNWGLYVRVSGAYTLLASIGSAPANGDVLRLVVSGTNTVTPYINGVAYGPYTATGISTSSVNAGMRGYTNGGVPNTALMDNFAAV